MSRWAPSLNLVRYYCRRITFETPANLFTADTLKQFYNDGWGDLKNADVCTTIHDAFEGVDGWNDWGSGMWDVMVDTHHCMSWLLDPSAWVS